jgi:hypothetical protein
MTTGLRRPQIRPERAVRPGFPLIEESSGAATRGSKMAASTAETRIPTPTRSRERRIQSLLTENSVGGIVLIAIGVIVVVGRLVPSFQPYMLVSVAITCLIAFGATREYGFAVAAGITGGLGVGVLLTPGAPAGDQGGVFLLSFAAGFVAIWLLGHLADPATRNAWPLIPAAVLGTIGVSILTRQPSLVDWLLLVVAVLLVAAGVRALAERHPREHSR